MKNNLFKKLFRDFLKIPKDSVWKRFYRETSYINLKKQPNNNTLVKSWKNIRYKEYGQAIHIPLSSETTKNALSKLLQRKRSQREFHNYPISIKDLSAILPLAGGITNNNHRSYPSAGSLYPLEIYPIILHARDMPGGIYHYNVIKNSLEFLKNGDFSNHLSDITTQEWLKSASVVFVLTAIIEKLEEKYKQRSSRFVLLEAGHLCQNIYLQAQNNGFGCCSIGGFVDNSISGLLGLEENKEYPIYLVAIGK